MPENLENLNELIEAMLDKSISPEQCQLLQHHLMISAEVRQYYLDYVLMSTILRQYYNSAVPLYDKQQFIRVEEPEINPLREIVEQQLADAELAAKQQKEVISPKKQNFKERSSISLQVIYKVAGAIVAIVAIVFMLEFMARLCQQMVTAPHYIAVLGDTIDAQWSRGPLGRQLRASTLELLSGLAEIQMEDGSVVIMEGPCIVRLESEDQILVEKGKILARCDKNIGFMVRTPAATIVDYGTEFGVVVEETGQTRAFVFDGQVDFRAGSEIKVYSSSKRLYVGQAATLDGNNTVVYCEGQDRFVHNMKVHQQNLDIMAKYRGNLIVNGDFEADVAGDFDNSKPLDLQITNIAISGWQDDTVATIFEYGRFTDTFVDPDEHPVAPDRGKNFFVGVNDTVITQDIDIEELAYWIESGRMRYELSGWLGGYTDHNDACELILDIMDAQGNIIDSDKIGPVKAADRDNKSGFLQCQQDGLVPAGSVSIKVSLKSTQAVALADAYADNLELVLQETY